MEKSTNHITEYRENQDINFQGITSFKILNTGESTVDINTIPVYPGQTLKIVEEDGTFSDFNLKALFTEAGKLPKCKAIYKQLDIEAGEQNNNNGLEYTATLYGYEKGDVVKFSQNISGYTILTRSFDGGLNFLPENDIDLGWVDANTIVTYDRGGRLDTTAIQFRNNDLEVDSEVFVVSTVPFVCPATPFVWFDVDHGELPPFEGIKTVWRLAYQKLIDIGSSIEIVFLEGIYNPEYPDDRYYAIAGNEMFSSRVPFVEEFNYADLDSIVASNIIVGEDGEGFEVQRLFSTTEAFVIFLQLRVPGTNCVSENFKWIFPS